MRPSPTRVVDRFLTAGYSSYWTRLLRGIEKLLADIKKAARGKGYDPTYGHNVYSTPRDIARIMGHVGGSNPASDPDVILTFEGNDDEFGYTSSFAKKNRTKLKRVAKQAGYFFEDLSSWAIGFYPENPELNPDAAVLRAGDKKGASGRRVRPPTRG